MTGLGKGIEITQWVRDNRKIENYTAFAACLDYSGKGYSDWFLPSRDEMELICRTLYQAGVVDISDDYRTSSGESGNSYYQAWIIHSSGGTVESQLQRKSSLGRARAVRAF